MDITGFLDKAKHAVEAELQGLVPSSDTEPRRLHEAVRWSLFAGGKRIRPAIVYAVGSVFGVEIEKLSRTAAAIEMIHTYSLIHDDLPAMDDDDLRRGKATCHRQFDEATAILAGDVLQTLAFGAIARDDRLTPQTRIDLIDTISMAAGTPDGMVAGQQLDLGAEGRDLSLEAIEQIHLRKTGALIAAAAVCGAIIGDASDSEINSIGRFSSHLGLLFQITDDLLDVTAQTASLGKTAGKDVSAEKATYPRIIGVEAAGRLAQDSYSKCLVELEALGRDTRVLQDLATLVRDRTK
jgi:geranylgeranyl pyrophosphate synthase